MPIESVYRCDLCRTDTADVGSGWEESKRVFFDSKSIKLVRLNDPTYTSHTVLCGRCLTMLRNALSNKPLTGREANGE